MPLKKKKNQRKTKERYLKQMKAQNKIILGLLIAILNIATPSSHALVIGVDPAANWVGYMDVFGATESKQPIYGWYLFGSSWTLGDLKTTVSANGLTLQPNFNCYANNPGDAFWRDGNGSGTGGNKWMQATTYTEQRGLYNGGLLNFNFNVASNTLASGYTTEAFIKAYRYLGWFNVAAVRDEFGDIVTAAYDEERWDFGNANAVLATVTGAGDYSLTKDLSGFGANDKFQVGFRVLGMNANPANEVALGSVQVAAIPEPSSATLVGVGVAGLIACRMRRKS